MPKNTGVGSLSLLQQIFPTQELNRDLHCRQILYQLSYQGSPLQEIPKKLFELNTTIAFTLQRRKLRLREFLKPCPTCQLPCSCISRISTKIFLSPILASHFSSTSFLSAYQSPLSSTTYKLYSYSFSHFEKM